jgi:TonB family protein
MNNKRTKRMERSKYLLFLPLIALLLIAGNIEAIASDLQPQLPDVLLKTENTEMPADTTVFEIVEQMPEYPGGTKALEDYLKRSIRYPQKAAKNKVQGRVIVELVIDKEGNVVNPRIFRGVNPELDKEALRVVKAMPKWTPGIQHGKKVFVKYTIPISFRLQ